MEIMTRHFERFADGEETKEQANKELPTISSRLPGSFPPITKPRHPLDAARSYHRLTSRKAVEPFRKWRQARN
jgi:hypothetical protein